MMKQNILSHSLCYNVLSFDGKSYFFSPQKMRLLRGAFQGLNI